MALIGTTAWYGPTAPKDWREKPATAGSKGIQTLSESQATCWVSNAFLDIDCCTATCKLPGDADLPQLPTDMRKPTGVIVGEEDFAALIAMSEQMQRAMTNATLAILPKLRRLAPIECPTVSADGILALMKRIAAPI